MKLVAIFEDERRTFVLKFQQELIDLGWEVDVKHLGGNKFKLSVSRDERAPMLLYAFKYNERECIVRNVIDDRTRSFHSVYFYSGQEFADYAHGHNL
jgi:hypothetical protein